MTVLISGGAGFFGSALVRAFARAGHDVIVLDLTPEGQAQRRPDTPTERVRYEVGDIADRSTLDPARFHDVTGIVHAAALSLPNEKEMDQRIVDVNLGGTTNILHLATQIQGCTKFLYVSSAGVYIQTEPGVLTESDATGGRSLYGATKIAAEAIVRRYALLFGLDFGIVRPTSLWGPGEAVRSSRPLVTPLCQLVDHAMNQRAVRIDREDSGCDWIYVDDGAAMASAFYESEMAGRVVTLSSGRTVPFSMVVQAAVDVFGLKVDSASDVVVDAGPARPATLSNDGLVAAVGHAPPHDLHSGMKAYRAFLTAVQR